MATCAKGKTEWSESCDREAKEGSKFCHFHWWANHNACCQEAIQIKCECMVAYDCPVHGEKHVGEHE